MLSFLQNSRNYGVDVRSILHDGRWTYIVRVSLRATSIPCNSLKYQVSSGYCLLGPFLREDRQPDGRECLAGCIRRLSRDCNSVDLAFVVMSEYCGSFLWATLRSARPWRMASTLAPMVAPMVAPLPPWIVLFTSVKLCAPAFAQTGVLWECFAFQWRLVRVQHKGHVSWMAGLLRATPPSQVTSNVLFNFVIQSKVVL